MATDLLEAIDNLQKARAEMAKHYGSVDAETEDDVTVFKCGDCGKFLYTQYWSGINTGGFPLICCDKIRMSV